MSKGQKPDWLPKRSHLVQKSVDFDKLSAKAQAIQALFNQSGVWLWGYKYDGCHMMLVVDADECVVLTREGNLVFSCEHIAKEAYTHLGNGVFFAECWNPNMTFEEISGKFRSHSPQPELEAYIFDYVPLKDWFAGHSDMQYGSRQQHIHRTALFETRYLFSALTFDPIHLQSHYERIANLRKLMKFKLDGDGAGSFVAMRIDATWKAGGGSEGNALKVKDHISVDLKIESVSEGTGEWSGKAGSVVCDFEGVLINVQAGSLPHDIRLLMFKHPWNYIGKYIEVHALGKTNGGKLREPRIARFRPDKD